MRVLALETFDEAGQLRSDGAGLSAVLARLGSQGLETAVAITQRPIEQRIDGNRRSFRMRDVVGASGDFLGTAREFAAGKTFDHQRRDQPVAKQGQFFGFGIHAENLHAPDDNQERRSSAMQMLCRDLRKRSTRRPAWFAALPERDTQEASPADGHEAAKTGNDARRFIRWMRASAGLWKRSPLPDPEGAPAAPAGPAPGSRRAPVFENGGSRTARADKASRFARPPARRSRA